MADLIVTLVANYELADIEPFLASWREHARRAKLLVFTTECDASLHQACDRLGVETIEVDGAWRYSLLVDRHLHFHTYLETAWRGFDSVLISDARDVVFQSDPFRVSRDGEVWFAAEDATFLECAFNRMWIAGIYGAPTADEFGPETVCCAGTTIGSSEGVLKYLELMRLEFEERPKAAAAWGDQGFHNHVYYKRRPDFIVLDRADRVVQTLNHTDPGRLSIRGGKVRVDGVAAPIVHQWDRHPELVRFLRRRYVLDRPDGGSGTAALHRWLPALARAGRPGRLGR